MYETVKKEMLHAKMELVRLEQSRGELMDAHDIFKKGNKGATNFKTLADIKYIRDKIVIYSRIYTHNKNLLLSLSHDSRTRI